jgi:AcrR family transcriptional regulator
VVTEKALGERGAARREEIIDAAIELFARHGYRGTGLLTLAKRVGMSHTGILSYFGTKEGLLKAVMERRTKIRDAQLSHYEGVGIIGLINVGSPNEPEVMTRLATVLRAENLNPDDPLYDYFIESNRRTRHLLATLIRREQRSGEVRADIDPDAKAGELLSFTIGLDTQWLLNPDEIDRRKVFESFARAQLTDLTPLPASASGRTASRSTKPEARKPRTPKTRR